MHNLCRVEGLHYHHHEGSKDKIMTSIKRYHNRKIVHKAILDNCDSKQRQIQPRKNVLQQIVSQYVSKYRYRYVTTKTHGTELKDEKYVLTMMTASLSKQYSGQCTECY